MNNNIYSQIGQSDSGVIKYSENSEIKKEFGLIYELINFEFDSYKDNHIGRMRIF